MAATIESAIKNPSQTSFTSRYCAKSKVYSCNNVDMSCTKKLLMLLLKLLLMGSVTRISVRFRPDELM